MNVPSCDKPPLLPRPFVRQGVPVAPLPRAVLDAARRLPDYDTVLAMMAEAVQRRRCTVQTLAHELEQGSQRGAALPRRALVPLSGGALAWEIDSYDCHFAHDDYADTLARDARNAAAGIVYLPTLPSRLRTEPDQVLAELRAAYETARRRPRSNLHTR